MASTSKRARPANYSVEEVLEMAFAGDEDHLGMSSDNSLQAGSPYGLFRDLLSNGARSKDSGGKGWWGETGRACNDPCTI